MRQLKNTVSIAALFLGLVAGPGAYASKAYYSTGNGNVANGEAIFKNGKGDVPACQSCHGEDGSGNDDMKTPRLAGQYFNFIYKQLEDFAADRRIDRTMSVMNANAKGLTEQDRRDVATYVSSKHTEFKGSDLAAIKAGGEKVGEIYKGRALVEYGSPERNDGFPKELGSKGAGVSACKSCHGVAGNGAPPMYPMIGQQRYTYLVNQLKNWRDGSRANDPKGQMQAIAKRMSDDDIINAAAYLTQANPLTPGNRRTPYSH